MSGDESWRLEEPYKPNGGPVEDSESIDFRLYDMWDRAQFSPSPQSYTTSVVEETDSPTKEHKQILHLGGTNTGIAVQYETLDVPITDVNCGELHGVSGLQDDPMQDVQRDQLLEPSAIMQAQGHRLQVRGNILDILFLTECIAFRNMPPNNHRNSLLAALTTSRRTRMHYKDWQIDILNREYERDRKPHISVYKRIANEINVPVKCVRIWFKNRRAKESAAL
ncbi:Homeobox protein HD-5 [Taenia solium]|eukprot:TsM_000756700 transcript=TsM_000756700 gene=TsM_000756700